MPLLSVETDLAGFRQRANELLARQVPPEDVRWETVHTLADDLFAQPVPAPGERTRDIPRAAAAIVPASFLRLCEVVVLHQDPQRFTLLYRLLWRLVHEPLLRGNPLDPDMLQAQQMAHSVRRELHKLKAQLRWRAVPDDEHAGEWLHLAWFEPSHHVVEEVAPWLARRHAGLRWGLLTPQRCARWDRARLLLGPGASPLDAPGLDAGDERWLAAYRHVFGRRAPKGGET